MGICFGAIIGTSLFHFVGYFGSFFALSIFTALTLLFLFIFEEKTEPLNQNVSISLSYWDVVKVRRASLVIFGYALANSLLYSLEPTLALKLREDFHFPSSTIGFYFSILFQGQICTAILSMLAPLRWDMRPILLFSFFLAFAAPLMIGPS